MDNKNIHWINCQTSKFINEIRNIINDDTSTINYIIGKKRYGMTIDSFSVLENLSKELNSQEKIDLWKFDISQIIDIHFIKINKNDIVFDPKVRSFCKSSYPGHKKGCPNFGKNPNCPPNSPYLENEVMNNYEDYYILYGLINFKLYRKFRKIQHPEWTDKMCKNVLYWQNSAKNLLKEKYVEIIKQYPFKEILLLSSGGGFKKSKKFPLLPEQVYAMESVGIHVFNTLDNIDKRLNTNIKIERNPNNKVVLCCLICMRDDQGKEFESVIEMRTRVGETTKKYLRNLNETVGNI